MPHAVEQERDQCGKEVVPKNGKKVNDKSHLNGSGVLNHGPRVERTFVGTMVTARQIVRQWIQHKQAKQCSPKTDQK